MNNAVEFASIFAQAKIKSGQVRLRMDQNLIVLPEKIRSDPFNLCHPCSLSFIVSSYEIFFKKRGRNTKLFSIPIVYLR